MRIVNVIWYSAAFALLLVTVWCLIHAVWIGAIWFGLLFLSMAITEYKYQKDKETNNG